MVDLHTEVHCLENCSSRDWSRISGKKFRSFD